VSQVAAFPGLTDPVALMDAVAAASTRATSGRKTAATWQGIMQEVSSSSSAASLIVVVIVACRMWRG